MASHGASSSLVQLRLDRDASSASAAVAAKQGILDVPACCVRKSTLIGNLLDQLHEGGALLPLPLSWEEAQAWTACAEWQGASATARSHDQPHGGASRTAELQAEGDATLLRALKVCCTLGRVWMQRSGCSVHVAAACTYVYIDIDTDAHTEPRVWVCTWWYADLCRLLRAW